jgi:hypothetical protein
MQNQRIKHLISLLTAFSLLLSFVISPVELEAKRSSKSWGSSSKKRTSSRKSSYSQTSTSKSSSFDMAREKQKKQQKSYQAYQEYQNSKNQFKKDESVFKPTEEETNHYSRNINNFNSDDIYERKTRYYNTYRTTNRTYYRSSENYSPSYGVWDSRFLWALFGATPFLMAEMFYHHSDDSGLRNFKNSLEQEAQNNSQIADNLNLVENKISELDSSNIPKDSNYLPPNVTFDEAFSEKFLQKNSSTNENTNSNNHENNNDISIFDIILYLVLIILFIYIFIKATGFFNKKKSSTKIDAEELDLKKLPLNIRLGGIIDISAINTFLISNRTSLELNNFDSFKGYIRSIGKIKLNSDLTIYKIYISKEIDSPKDEIIFRLEIELINDEVQNIKIFKKYADIFPNSLEEWQEWLDGDDENYPNIGGLDFTTPNEKFYTRLWEENNENTVRYDFDESKYDDSSSIKNKQSILIKHSATLYYREINNSNKSREYLFASHIINEKEQLSFIQIDLGLEINQTDINII